MPIDASIYGQIQAPKQIDPLARYGQMAQIQHAQSQNRLADLMYSEKEREVGDNRAVSEAYKGATDPTTGALDRNKLFTAIAQGGQGRLLPGVQKGFADSDKLSAETKKLNTDNDKATFDLRIKKSDQAIKDIAGFTSPDQAVANLQQHVKSGDIDQATAQMVLQTMPKDPAQFPAWQIGMLKKIMTAKEQMQYSTPDANATLQAKTSRDNNAATNATTQRGQNLTDARGRESNAIARAKAGAAGPDGRPAKPMPATALKMQNEALDMIGIASSIQADLGTIEKQIAKGTLDFGPVKNVVNNAKNTVGMSDEQSRNLSTFKSSMEKLRNDSLRLNKGVQTDGDAQRAWNELFQNINDKELVKQRLSEIKAINARAVDLRKREVEDIRNNYNQQQYDFGTQTNVPSAITPPSGGGVPTADAIEAELARRAAARGGK